MSDPVIRRADIALPGWPAGAAPVTIALLSDIHLGNATTDAARVERIAEQLNAAKPDLVVIAGDFVAGHESADAAVASGLVAGLASLNAPLGVVAVLGNHDYWTEANTVRRALRRAKVTVLRNEAVRRGPVVIGGIDDQPTRHADLTATLAAIARLSGPAILLAHSPDIAAALPPTIGLLLAGHTHCGQIVLPLFGPPVDVSVHGARYRCGIVREGMRTTIIGAGTGTSVLPFRFGAPPDIWLVRVGPLPSGQTLTSPSSSPSQ